MYSLMHHPSEGSERTLGLSEGSLASLCFLAVRRQVELKMAYTPCTQTNVWATIRFVYGTSKSQTCEGAAWKAGPVITYMYHVLQTVHNLNLNRCKARCSNPTFNLSSWETKEGRSLWVWGHPGVHSKVLDQPGQHNKTLSQKQKPDFKCC